MAKSLFSDPRAEDFPVDKKWVDEIVCGMVRRNRDGSLTVTCQINIYDEEHNTWSTHRQIRLQRDK